jgi:peptidoglycan/xylan/chitin deacetylase (PgdA/CDA1 family)
VADVLERRGRHVLVTFDDGYRDNYELAFPVLRRHGVSAAFFVVSGFIDQPRLPWWDEFAWMAESAPDAVLPAGEWLAADLPMRPTVAAVRELTTKYKALPAHRAEAFLDWCGQAAGCGRADSSLADELWMTWDMAREMREAGMAFGGHTDTHPVLARLDRAGQDHEVARCKERLEAELGDAMRLFSYPVGLRDSFDANTRDCLREHDVELAFSCYGGFQEPGGDPYDVKRANVSPRTDAARLNAMLVSPRLFARW